MKNLDFEKLKITKRDSPASTSASGPDLESLDSNWVLVGSAENEDEAFEPDCDSKLSDLAMDQDEDPGLPINCPLEKTSLSIQLEPTAQPRSIPPIQHSPDSSIANMTPRTDLLRDNASFAEMLIKDMANLGTYEPTQSISTDEDPRGKQSRRRILHEFRNFACNPIPPSYNISYRVLNNDIHHGLGIIAGPPGTPFEGGIFHVKVELAEDYPIHGFKMRFLTKMFHPNISEDGHVYVDFLRNMWSPVITIETGLLMLSALLDDPALEEPLEGEPVELYKLNRGLYDEMVREYTREYATGVLPDLETI